MSGVVAGAPSQMGRRGSAVQVFSLSENLGGGTALPSRALKKRRGPQKAELSGEDNAAMIGCQGFYEFQAGHTAGLELNAYVTRDIALG